MENSDRAALKQVVPIVDGRFGSEIEVVATKDGLELGGYFTLRWDWIALAYQSVRLSGDKVPPLNRDSSI